MYKKTFGSRILFFAIFFSIRILLFIRIPSYLQINKKAFNQWQIHCKTLWLKFHLDQWIFVSLFNLRQFHVPFWYRWHCPCQSLFSLFCYPHQQVDLLLWFSCLHIQSERRHFCLPPRQRKKNGVMVTEILMTLMTIVKILRTQIRVSLQLSRDM